MWERDLQGGDDWRGDKEGVNDSIQNVLYIYMLKNEFN